MYYLLILVIILADQAAKYLVRMEMTLNQSIPLINGVFDLTYIHNYGAAFSILEGKQFLLIGITFLAVAAITVYIVRKRKTAHFTLLLGLSMIVGGGCGNLIDRILQGYVVDFLNIRFWPIFNLADMAVVSGCLLLMIYLLWLEPKAARQKNQEMEDVPQEK